MNTSKQSAPKKPSIQSTMLLFFISAGLAAAAPPSQSDLSVNAYGERSGFGNQPDGLIPGFDANKIAGRSCQPGALGLYVVAGTVDHRTFESMGDRQARIMSETRGSVTIGALEVIDSGPTGQITPDARLAARQEVTTQVLERIQATDKVMASLGGRSSSLDRDAQSRFNAAAGDVAEHRRALREDLKTMRAADDANWSAARTAVSVSFNSYVQTMHRAEETSSTGSGS